MVKGVVQNGVGKVKKTHNIKVEYDDETNTYLAHLSHSTEGGSFAFAGMTMTQPIEITKKQYDALTKWYRQILDNNAKKKV